MKENCKNCKYRYELWYWNNYPKEKMQGNCCIVLKDDKDGFVMQLYDIENDRCELFERK